MYLLNEFQFDLIVWQFVFLLDNTCDNEMNTVHINLNTEGDYLLLCVCVWVCKHRQPRTYSDIPQSDRGQNCKWGRSSICEYVQTVANCLLLHIGVCWRRKKEKTCTGFGPRFSAEKSYTSCVSVIYTKSVPQLPIVRRTRTSSFSE